MPKTIKKRVPKKSVEPPEIGEFQSIFLTIYQENRKAILSAVAVIVIVAAAGIGLAVNRSRQAEKASVLESQGIAELRKKAEAEGGEPADMSKALEYFEQAAAAKKTPFSLFYAAETFLKLGDTENAIRKYREFLKKFGDSTLAGPVRTRIALILEKRGDTESALEELEKAGREELGGDTALSQMAEIYKRMEKPDQEREVLERLAAGNPNSPWTIEAKARVEMEAKSAAEEGKEVTTGEGGTAGK